MKRSSFLWIAAAFAVAVTALALGTAGARGGFAKRPMIKISTRLKKPGGVARPPILPIELSDGTAAHLFVVTRLYDEAGNEVDGFEIPADGDGPAREAKEITVTVGVTQGNAPVIGTEVHLFDLGGASEGMDAQVIGSDLSWLEEAPSQPTDVDGLARFRIRVTKAPAGGMYKFTAGVRNTPGCRLTLTVKQ